MTTIFTNVRAVGPAIVVPRMTNDGKLDIAAMRAYFEDCIVAAEATGNVDFDTTAKEIQDLFLGKEFLNERAKSIEHLIFALNRAYDRAGGYKVTELVDGKSHTRDMTFAEAARTNERREEVLREYIASKPNQFLMSKGNGVLIRYVDGDERPSKSGELEQHYRFTPEEWRAKELAVQAAEAKNAAKKAAASAKTA